VVTIPHSVLGASGLKDPNKGRHGLTARQVAGARVVTRIKAWHYRELRERFGDGVILRQFTDSW
jgi:hypothetical protein